MNKTMQTTKRFFFVMFITIGIAISQPKLSLDKSEVDLGAIFSGTKKQGKIVLNNIGNDTLHIYSVQPSCGCTAVKQPKKFLLPYESDVVSVEFNSTGYHGKIEKYINITTNDPASKNLSVKLIAEVREELEWKNSTSWLGNIEIGKTLEQKIYLKNVSEHAIKIKGFTVSSPSISAKLEIKTINPNDSLDVQVTVKAVKVGYVNEYILIDTDNKNQPRVNFRISFMCEKK